MRRLLLAFLMLMTGIAAASTDDLKPFVKATWPQILKSHAGHPTIVHFWGMTCGPCKIEMPRWGVFLATHSDVDMVTIDTDVAVGAPGAAEAFLASAHVPTTDAWRFADSLVEKLYFAVDPNWQGEIPLTLLIGRDGVVTRKLGATQTNEVEQWLAAQHKK
jgi:thiol-disulfide isomerase/thioredoxin